jgi:hypothetical protein
VPIAEAGRRIFFAVVAGEKKTEFELVFVGAVLASAPLAVDGRCCLAEYGPSLKIERTLYSVASP